ncbi:hypothetical protein EVAR_40955_1 [Eumeta japonica]|uniref:Uncharacterized protein n=1 Tax=Eumeta variegata TaxID=151549 RepID=A0A4C1X806_EUMVA|nr:hypothetical protein EVAR_40955_1 [Eumeta japonica]
MNASHVEYVRLSNLKIDRRLEVLLYSLNIASGTMAALRGRSRPKQENYLRRKSRDASFASVSVSATVFCPRPVLASTTAVKIPYEHRVPHEGDIPLAMR